MVFFIFNQVVIENYASTDQAPHSVASDLGLRYSPMSHIKVARHIWVKNAIILLIS